LMNFNEHRDLPGPTFYRHRRRRRSQAQVLQEQNLRIKAVEERCQGRRRCYIDLAQQGASGPRKGQKSTSSQQFVFTN
jgi:hypothetical protein